LAENRQFHKFIISTVIVPFAHDSVIRWENALELLSVQSIIVVLPCGSSRAERLCDRPKLRLHNLRIILVGFGSNPLLLPNEPVRSERINVIQKTGAYGVRYSGSRRIIYGFSLVETENVGK
jgi:hypothetical protein